MIGQPICLIFRVLSVDERHFWNLLFRRVTLFEAIICQWAPHYWQFALFTWKISVLNETWPTLIQFSSELLSKIAGNCGNKATEFCFSTKLIPRSIGQKIPWEVQYKCTCMWINAHRPSWMDPTWDAPISLSGLREKGNLFIFETLTVADKAGRSGSTMWVFILNPRFISTKKN